MEAHATVARRGVYSERQPRSAPDVHTMPQSNTTTVSPLASDRKKTKHVHEAPRRLAPGYHSRTARPKRPLTKCDKASRRNRIKWCEAALTATPARRPP
jgi:hypothetical protein